MSDRKEFEAWLLEVHGLTAEWQPERNCFKEYPAHLAYQAWQASRAALVVDLPETHKPGHEDDERWHNIRNNTIAACKRAIEAAGARVKT